MKDGWRYIAQRATTGEWLDWDLPIDVEETSWALSGPGALRGTIAPDVGVLRADDGDLLLDEWGTYLYAEADGEIRWGGIITRSSFEAGQWKVEASGFSTYPHGVPYSGDWGSKSVDPLDAFREIWRHVQAYPDGDLGVVVDATTSPVRLGVEPTPAYWAVSLDGGTTFVREDSVDPALIEPSPSVELRDPITDKALASLAADITSGATSLTLKSLDRFGELTAPYVVTVGSERVRVGARSGLTLSGLTRGYGSSSPTAHSAGVSVTFTDLPQTSLRLKSVGKFADLTAPYEISVGSEKMLVHGRSGLTLTNLDRGYAGTTKASTHSAGTKVTHDGTPRKKIPRDPGEKYELAWWNAPDCGQEMDTLAQGTPFDYVEEHSWATPSDSLAPVIAHRLRLGYPRMGRRRFDLSFVQGVNVSAPVFTTRNGDAFANDALGLGAGDGKKKVRVVIAERDGRLRRPLVYTNGGVKATAHLRNLTRRELAAHRNLLEVTEVEVSDHADAPFGSWTLGDDVLIRATVPWLGDVEVWSRVVGWSLVSASRAKLALVRSDSFTYGRPADG